MFNIFKKEENEKENNHPSIMAVACLLIHSARIDENYTDKEKKIIKDAIVDQFRKHKNQRPSVDIKKPDFHIHIHIAQKKCNISINSSGPSLHKRGYRSNQFNAPINEVLAAGIIMLSNWNQKEAGFFSFWSHSVICYGGEISVKKGFFWPFR